MTGYTVHTGSTDKFRSGWDKIFKSKKTRSTAAQVPAKNADQKGKAKGASKK